MNVGLGNCSPLPNTKEFCVVKSKGNLECVQMIMMTIFGEKRSHSCQQPTVVIYGNANSENRGCCLSHLLAVSLLAIDERCYLRQHGIGPCEPRGRFLNHPKIQNGNVIRVYLSMLNPPKEIGHKFLPRTTEHCSERSLGIREGQYFFHHTSNTRRGFRLKKCYEDRDLSLIISRFIPPSIRVPTTASC